MVSDIPAGDEKNLFLHCRLAESIPGLLKSLQIWALNGGKLCIQRVSQTDRKLVASLLRILMSRDLGIICFSCVCLSRESCPVFMCAYRKNYNKRKGRCVVKNFYDNLFFFSGNRGASLVTGSALSSQLAEAAASYSGLPASNTTGL